MPNLLKIFMIVFLLFATSANITNTFTANAAPELAVKVHEPLLKASDAQKYISQGYSKEEVYRAALISNFSKKDVSEVLKTYKETKSWEKTAQKYNLDLATIMKEHHKKKEEFLNAHQDDVLKVLSVENEVTVAKLNSYLEEGVSLRFLIAATAIAKNTTTPYDNIIKLKKSGSTLEKIHTQLKTDRQSIHEDMHYVLEEIRKEIEKNHPELQEQP